MHQVEDKKTALKKKIESIEAARTTKDNPEYDGVRYEASTLLLKRLEKVQADGGDNKKLMKSWEKLISKYDDLAHEAMVKHDADEVKRLGDVIRAMRLIVATV